MIPYYLIRRIIFVESKGLCMYILVSYFCLCFYTTSFCYANTTEMNDCCFGFRKSNNESLISSKRTIKHSKWGYYSSLLPVIALRILSFSLFLQYLLSHLCYDIFFMLTTFKKRNFCHLELPSPWTIDCEERKDVWKKG